MHVNSMATKFGLTATHAVDLAEGGKSTREVVSEADVPVRLAKRPLAERQGISHGDLIGRRGCVAPENLVLLEFQSVPLSFCRFGQA